MTCEQENQWRRADLTLEQILHLTDKRKKYDNEKGCGMLVRINELMGCLIEIEYGDKPDLCRDNNAR